jgi:hypothetical protein
MAHLARVGEVSDHTGKASTMLAATIGYPGSSVAFAQLLTGMERAGLIQREIRGKRTYRIIPGPAAPPPDALTQPAPAPGDAAPGGVTRPAQERPRPAAAAAQAAAAQAAAAQRVPEPAGPPGGTARRADAATAEAPGTGAAAETGPAAAGLNLPAGPGGLDYDELARRLLVQVVRRLAGPDAGRVPGDRDADDLGAAYRDAAAASSHPGQPVRHETARHETAQPETALQETVASLEQKLASATSRQRRLAEENTRLREQLRAAEQSLAEAQDRATAEALAGRFDSAEVLLLERLLSPLREQRRQPPEADAG